MRYTIVCKGEESIKAINLTKRLVSPFIGVKKQLGGSEMGLGLISHSGDVLDFYHPVFESLLIQSWRAMHILESLTHVWNNTLQACWVAGAREIHFFKQYLMESLQDQIGWKFFSNWRQEVVSKVPNDYLLNQMFNVLQKNQIDIDLWELQIEVKEGRLKAAPFLVNLFKKESEKHRQQLQKDCEFSMNELKQIKKKLVLAS